MWIRKKIPLLSDPRLLSGGIITREAIAEHQQALSILEAAEQQALQRLNDASHQADRLKRQMREQHEQVLAEQLAQHQQDFLHQAEQFFAEWQQQQAQWQANLLPNAEALLSQALAQLIAELPPSERVQALLQQLLKAQGRPAPATLLCASEQHPAVERWLATRPQLEWQVSSDGSLAADSMILTTPQGELHLSWAQICPALIPDI